MSDADQNFTGIWLHNGSRQGQAFSHTANNYDHSDDNESQAPTGSTRMRHVFVEQDGQKVGVWVPESWSEEEAREALETNW